MLKSEVRIRKIVISEEIDINRSAIVYHDLY